MSIDWALVRAEFPALERWTFLNTATFGQLPRRGVAAIARHLEHRDELACSDFLEWFDDMDQVRGSVARLIHATADDIAFIPNASTGLATLLHGLPWTAGDRIVTLEGEFPNNLYAPYFAGASVEVVETSWDRLYDAITPRTRLVLLSILNYASGFRPPLEELAPYLRERGVLLYVDGTQGVGALEFDVSRIRPAMLAVHGYKWLLSPNGAGFMYVDPELRDRLEPSEVGWRSDRRWREVDNLHHGRPEFKTSAEKYEGGMLSFSLLYAMQASIELMLELGPANIERRTLGLADLLRARLREVGGEVADGPTPIVSARFPGRDVSAMARSLAAQGILVSARHGNLRVSPHLYNDESDVDRLIRELAADERR
jgi:selenocysteine lyase/cysteine desulfurase